MNADMEYAMQQIDSLPLDYARVAYGARVVQGGHSYDLYYFPNEQHTKWEAWSPLAVEKLGDKVGGGGSTPIAAILACQDWKAMLRGESDYAPRNSRDQ